MGNVSGGGGKEDRGIKLVLDCVHRHKLVEIVVK